jgi:hypothetical protein
MRKRIYNRVAFKIFGSSEPWVGISMWSSKSESVKKRYVREIRVSDRYSLSKRSQDLGIARQFTGNAGTPTFEEGSESWVGTPAETQLPRFEKPTLSSLTDSLVAYVVWSRVMSFTTWGTFSSLFFTAVGIYLTLSGILQFQVGVTLSAIFGLFSFVFSAKLLQWRKR